MAWTERYVSVAGGGDHDGTSEANAWTLAELDAATISAGTRVNIKAGSYSSGAISLSDAGTQSSRIVYSGYNSTIEDLDDQGRNTDSTLDTTNFPVITLTGALTPGNWNIFMNLHITGSISGDLINGSGPDYVIWLHNKIVNSANNASARALVMDNYCYAVNNDIECTGTTHSSVVHGDALPALLLNRIKATYNGDALVNVRIPRALIGNMLIGAGSSCNGFNITTALDSVCFVMNNTIYNCNKMLTTANAAPTGDYKMLFVINNHATDSAEWIDNQYSATADVFIIELFNRTRDVTTLRTGLGDSFNIGEVTTDTGGPSTDYVDATNGNLILTSGAAGIDAGIGIG